MSAGAPDWAALRGGFHVTRRFAYLNAAATGPLHERALAAARDFHEQVATFGDIPFMSEWLPRLQQVREAVAALLGTGARHVAFTQGASHGMNLVARRLLAEGPRRRVVTLRDEFPSSTLPLLHHGFEARFVEPDCNNRYDPGAIAAAVDADTAAVVVSHVQYGTGFRLDPGALRDALGGRDVRLVLNCTQSAGQLPVQLDAWGVDAAVCAGHKWLCSGYGNGLLFVGERWLDRHPPDLGWLGVEDPMAMDNQEFEPRADAQAWQYGCPDFGNRFVLGAALDLLLEIGAGQIAARVRAMSQRLAEGLTARGWPVVSPRDPDCSSGIVTFEADDPNALRQRLFEAGVVLVPRGRGRLRAGVHYYNDESDVDRLLEALPPR